jgi:hypothetical protein
MSFSKRLTSASKRRSLVRGTWLPGVFCLGGAAAAPAPAPTDAQSAAWSAEISHTPVPAKGCFTAAYPSTTWTPVECTTAPDRRYEPAHGTAGDTVGDGADYAAVASGLIASSVGSFPAVKGVTKEKDGTVANEYSLQLNTQFFSGSPACSGASTPSSCLAWQQYVFSNSGGKFGGGVAFMQYWLIDYGSSCPAGWMSFSGDCYRNSSAVQVPEQAITQLKYLSVSGSAVGGNLASSLDGIVLTTKAQAYSATGYDVVVDLADFWTASEFNVFGDGDSTEATFNAGPTVTVKIALQDGTTKKPTCNANSGTTAETNNLTLGSCKAVPGKNGLPPYVQFTESN